MPGANGTENEKIGNDSTIIAGNKSNPSTSTPIPPATSDNIESFTMPTTPIMPTTPVESDSIQDAGRLAPSPALFSTPRSLRINESYVSISKFFGWKLFAYDFGFPYTKINPLKIDICLI